jgi:tetratricopeptide (TPR) repeat protein
MGWVNFKLKRYDEAVRNLERSRELSPEDPTIAFHLGEAYFVRKEYKKALAQYKFVLSEEPERLDVQERIRRIKSELEAK